jgi:hypothetical protein
MVFTVKNKDNIDMVLVYEQEVGEVRELYFCVCANVCVCACMCESVCVCAYVFVCACCV